MSDMLQLVDVIIDECLSGSGMAQLTVSVERERQAKACRISVARNYENTNGMAGFAFRQADVT